MKRRNFFGALVALVTAPMTLLKGSERCTFNPAVLEKRRKEITDDPRKGQTVVMYTNATSPEQPDLNTYRFSENGWNPNAFEIRKSERIDNSKVKLYLRDTDDHNIITRGMMAVFEDEEVGFVSDVARGFPRDFCYAITVTLLNIDADET